MPGIARIGHTDSMGFDGPMMMSSDRSIASRTPGAGDDVRGPTELHAEDRVLVAATDEVRLEIELADIGDHGGAHDVVGRRKYRGLDIHAATYVGGDRAETVSGPQPSTPVQVDCQVQVTQAERDIGFREPTQLFHDSPRLPGSTPSLRALGPGECVHHGVEVGSHVDPVDEIVVGHVHDYRDVRSGGRNQATGHPSATHTAREHHELHRSSKVNLVMTASTDLPSETEDGSETPATPTVVAAVLFVDEVSLPVTLESVRKQVYEVERLVIVGDAEAAAGMASKRNVEHVSAFGDMVAGLGADVDYVWVVHGDARPRPDALGALVAETERNEASLVGSKILDGVETDRLESVGAATDVFGEPYTGLDPDEVDLEQYDVVRDVAFISGVSMLMRRDLIRGLRGIDPNLPPVSAGLDLSQRARIAGGRVMVAPSSEVLHLHRCQHEDAGWRERAGRMRAMLKAYRWITLLWAMPAGWVLGLVDAIARLVLGEVKPFTDLMRASAWNLARLPSTLAARNAVRAIRATGDEELFRYQVSGSVRMRALGADLASRFGWFIDQEPGVVTEDELEREVSVAGPVGLIITALVVGLGTRGLILGTAVGEGFWLPLHPEAGSVIRSYAGGWNPAGLGSTETLHPAAALAATVQWLLGGWTGALGLVTLAVVVGGVWGVARLLSRLGVGGAAKWLAGVAYLLGPFAMVYTSDAYWPGLAGLGALPWLVDAVIDHPEGSGRRTIGKVARIVMAAGLTAAFAPAAVAVPLVVVALAIPIMSRSGVRHTALWWSLIALVAGADVVAPYLLGVPGSALTLDVLAGDLWPSPVVALALLTAALFASLFGRSANAKVAGWGGAMVGAALLLAALPQAKGEVLVAVVALASLGAAFVVGGALHLDFDVRRTEGGGSEVAAVVSAIVLLAFSAPVCPRR